MIGQKGMPAIHGGVERHVHDLSLRLVKKGYEVTAYSRKWYTGKDKDFFFDGVLIKHLPSIHTKHFDAISHTFLATIDTIRNDYDVIHYHGVGPSLLAWIPRLFSRKTLVLSTFHSIDRYHEKWNWLAKFFLRIGEWAACKLPHQTITVSQSLENYCIKEFKKNTTCIPNGVELQDVNIPPNGTLKKFNLEKNKYLVMISRLVKHKGAHILIEAFNQLKSENKDNSKINELKLAIVGGSAYTDKYVAELHTLANASNDIIFTDFQSGDALEELYANALTLVHPSLNEGLPITVLHGMAYTKAVLVSNIAEHRELIEDSRFIFREDNVENLKNKILEFINMDSADIKKVGLKNRQIIAENYHWDKLIPKIEKVYNQSVITIQKLKTAENI